MNIIQLTPGAGAMFCGNCFRDNALVAALRKMGHSVTMAPLYLPLTLDEEDQSAREPIFFGGINVYLEQLSKLFNRTPNWMHSLLASRPLLWWAAGKAAKTRAQDVGEITLSMLRGEEGNQIRELDQLLQWLVKTQPKTDIICLSNALLLGLGRRLKTELRAPLVCTLQGEDSFLDALPADHRAACSKVLIERAREVDVFIAPSQYFARRMGDRLQVPADRIRVVHNGIDLAGYDQPATTDSAKSPPSKNDTSSPPVLGFFARMCREKGLDTLVESFILLKKANRIKSLKLRVGGSCGPSDQILVEALRAQLKSENLLHDVEFHPNLDRAQKIAFLKSLTVFSVPALYGEAYGLYLIEALASGVPIVQPDTAAFPEIISATGGGILCEPGSAAKLAEAIATLLLDPARAFQLGQTGKRAVFEKFNADTMAGECVDIFEKLKPHSESKFEKGIRA